MTFTASGEGQEEGWLARGLAGGQVKDVDDVALGERGGLLTLRRLGRTPREAPEFAAESDAAKEDRDLLRVREVIFRSDGRDFEPIVPQIDLLDEAAQALADQESPRLSLLDRLTIEVLQQPLDDVPRHGVLRCLHDQSHCADYVLHDSSVPFVVRGI